MTGERRPLSDDYTTSTPRGVEQASRAHIFAESAVQNPYIFHIAGLCVYRPAGTAGVNLNKVRR